MCFMLLRKSCPKQVHILRVGYLIFSLLTKLLSWAFKRLSPNYNNNFIYYNYILELVKKDEKSEEKVEKVGESLQIQAST